MDFGFIPMPEEMRAHMEEQAAKQEMFADSYRHAVQRMFDELSREHLETLRQILHNLTMSGSTLAAYYEGQVATSLHTRFNVCSGCGVNHDEQAEDLGQPEQSQESQTIVVAGDLTHEDLTNMETYNLDDLREEGTNNLVGFICKACGLKYSSIADRMVAEPDKCSGCIQKAKWG
jgi:hypothetical protein